MILVLGGGFGLYGHVPALLASGKSVASLRRYQQKFESRVELRDLASALHWYDDEEAALASAEVVVLARRPSDNAALAERIARRGGPRLVIEKPIAESAAAGRRLAESLAAHDRTWSTPYLLQYCTWYDALAERLAAGCQAVIRWRFTPSPNVNSWKRHPTEGGGALAFYFIHCLALLEWSLPGANVELAREVAASGAITLRAVAIAPHSRMTIEFTLSQGEMDFVIEGDPAISAEFITPFGAAPVAGVPDPRIPILARFYEHAVFGPAPQGQDYHDRVLRHWTAFEALA